MKHGITIEVDDEDGALQRWTDSYLAVLWHVTQANPAPHGDQKAGSLAEKVGREIIRRFLTSTPPELWSHQGRDHFSKALGEHCSWNGATWVRRTAQELSDLPVHEGSPCSSK